MHLTLRSLTPKSVYVLHFPLHRPLLLGEQLLVLWTWGMFENKGVGGWNQTGSGWEAYILSPLLPAVSEDQGRRSLLRTGLRDPSAVSLRAGCLLILDCVLPDHAPALTHLSSTFFFPLLFLILWRNVGPGQLAAGLVCRACAQ